MNKRDTVRCDFRVWQLYRKEGRDCGDDGGNAMGSWVVHNDGDGGENSNRNNKYVSFLRRVNV